MHAVDTPTSSTEIMKAFEGLLSRHAEAADALRTRAEEAARAADVEAAERASGTTVRDIVTGLASLQLEVSGELEGLGERLTAEHARLDDLRRAIRVTTERRDALRDLRVAAEALSLLTFEHKQAMAKLEAELGERKASLEAEMADSRADWASDQAEHERSLNEAAATLSRDRTREADDYAWKIERQARVRADEHAAAERQMHQKMSAIEAEKSRNWAERRATLDAAAGELEALRVQSEARPAEVAAAVDKARSAAIKKAMSEAKTAMELAQQERTDALQVGELEIAALEKTIARQAEQLAALQAQLDVATQQSQELAVKAMEPRARQG